MFRLTQYLKELINPTPLKPVRSLPGPIVIWNLIRRCNLTCKHCYSISADKDFPGELSTKEVFHVMDDLKAFGVPVLILSGGEPLLHPDIFVIAQRAKAMGFYLSLSSNGTLINEANIEAIVKVGFDYVGISVDGTPATHDRFRRCLGAFEKALQGVRWCQLYGIKVGIRFTLTQDNVDELPQMWQLIEDENIDKFYLSHLNYAGRGNKNRQDDVHHQMTRQAMDFLIENNWQRLQAGENREIVTGNNDADGVYLLLWVKHHFPDKFEHLQAKLAQWGGNSSGVNIANIDNLGQVHPDTFWWHYSLGQVRERPFSEIWMDTTEPLMAGLKQRPRPLKGRCGQCHYQAICGGNTRTRAYQLTGDPWAEDPACYLTDAEIEAFDKT
jgi:heme d1 biosynthesis radical SAM protein NirJ